MLVRHADGMVGKVSMPRVLEAADANPSGGGIEDDTHSRVVIFGFICSSYHFNSIGKRWSDSSSSHCEECRWLTSRPCCVTPLHLYWHLLSTLVCDFIISILFSISEYPVFVLRFTYVLTWRMGSYMDHR